MSMHEKITLMIQEMLDQGIPLGDIALYIRDDLIEWMILEDMPVISNDYALVGYEHIHGVYVNLIAPGSDHALCIGQYSNQVNRKFTYEELF
jgi:hypothetical protein